jgi:ATP-dependent Clp protease adapter protein ClpS
MDAKSPNARVYWSMKKLCARLERGRRLFMAEKKKKEMPADAGKNGGGSSTATAKPKRASKTKPKQKPPQMLPPWKVLLHNDDKNEMMFVVATIVELTTLNEQDAKQRTLEAHETGVALLLTTHKERAELYKDQFESKGLTVTIEPAEK